MKRQVLPFFFTLLLLFSCNSQNSIRTPEAENESQAQNQDEPEQNNYIVEEELPSSDNLLVILPNNELVIPELPQLFDMEDLNSKVTVIVSSLPNPDIECSSVVESMPPPISSILANCEINDEGLLTADELMVILLEIIGSPNPDFLMQVLGEYFQNFNMVLAQIIEYTNNQDPQAAVAALVEEVNNNETGAIVVEMIVSSIPSEEAINESVDSIVTTIDGVEYENLAAQIIGFITPEEDPSEAVDEELQNRGEDISAAMEGVEGSVSGVIENVRPPSEEEVQAEVEEEAQGLSDEAEGHTTAVNDMYQSTQGEVETLVNENPPPSEEDILSEVENVSTQAGEAVDGADGQVAEIIDGI